MSVRDVALKVKKWAQANGMIGFTKEAPTVNSSTIRAIFGKVGVPIATKILQDKSITYVGVNDLADEIIIFTKKRLTIREQRLFIAASYKDQVASYSLKFEHGNFAHVGPPPSPPVGIPPFVTIGGKYTCGSSVYIGSEKGAGTLGCLVRSPSGELFGLSNNHVTGGSNYAPPGLPIVAPGSLDVAAGGMDPTTLGHHSRVYPFVDGLPDVVDATGNLDAALFAIADPSFVSSMQRNEYDTPTECIPLEIDMDVTKVGRTTGKRSGKVIAELFDSEPVIYDIDIIGGKKLVYFHSLFVIKGGFDLFSQPGDSGSLIITTDRLGVRKSVGIVGIVVAGDENGLTFALSLDRILQYFGVELVGSHNI